MTTVVDIGDEIPAEGETVKVDNLPPFALTGVAGQIQKGTQRTRNLTFWTPRKDFLAGKFDDGVIAVSDEHDWGLQGSSLSLYLTGQGAPAPVIPKGYSETGYVYIGAAYGVKWKGISADTNPTNMAGWPVTIRTGFYTTDYMLTFTLQWKKYIKQVAGKDYVDSSGLGRYDWYIDWWYSYRYPTGGYSTGTTSNSGTTYWGQSKWCLWWNNGPTDTIIETVPPPNIAMTDVFTVDGGSNLFGTCKGYVEETYD